MNGLRGCHEYLLPLQAFRITAVCVSTVFKCMAATECLLELQSLPVFTFNGPCPKHGSISRYCAEFFPHAVCPFTRWISLATSSRGVLSRLRSLAVGSRRSSRPKQQKIRQTRGDVASHFGFDLKTHRIRRPGRRAPRTLGRLWLGI